MRFYISGVSFMKRGFFSLAIIFGEADGGSGM